MSDRFNVSNVNLAHYKRMSLEANPDDELWHFWHLTICKILVMMNASMIYEICRRVIQSFCTKNETLNQ
jgi:hypothetical protein